MWGLGYRRVRKLLHESSHTAHPAMQGDPREHQASGNRTTNPHLEEVHGVVSVGLALKEGAEVHHSHAEVLKVVILLTDLGEPRDLKKSKSG